MVSDTTARNASDSVTSWRGVSDVAAAWSRARNCCGFTEASRQGARASDGHPNDFLVRLHQLVPQLYRQLQRHLGPLQRDHRVVNVAVPLEHLLNSRIGVAHGRIDGIDEP